MKVTIELTDAEVKGIKKYQKEVFGEKWAKPEIQEFVQSLVTGIINAPQEAVSDYIKAYSEI